MQAKIMNYLKNKRVEIDPSTLRYLDNGIEITEEAEFIHNFGIFPLHHNESWYFNFVDRPNKVYCISRFSFEMGQKRSRILFILVIDGKINTYFKEVPLEEMPANLEFNKRLQYICITPMKQWQLKFEDRNVKLDVIYNARFPVFNSMEVEDPLTSLKKYGVELLNVAAQHHYEQAMNVIGTLIVKKTDENREIKCLGNRDHSWGTRDWVDIDSWNWGAAQFEDQTLGFFRSNVLGKIPQGGFISSKDGNIPITGVAVITKTKKDGKTPVSSTFTLTDKNGISRTLQSKMIFNLRLPLPSERGFTEIFEQIVIYTCEGKEGDGISEYLFSKRNDAVI
jgi:hypothetical protein